MDTGHVFDDFIEEGPNSLLGIQRRRYKPGPEA
jgi:hypothetical protein